ncbi:EamA family transporter [Undibacterium sp. LX40W]|uniref:EamA family transporter n=1 Tax=Undibacterium nitidum TaxID=2762298 RepID=A0A923HKI2_9BURK|nr:DMT family transporter [Undibacterium nitidum]MBC3881074.1 EamA family transporter [Undibacterium nitidum]MBC3890193.1 EamA family transporter [Undibacterium sp. LX40W]
MPLTAFLLVIVAGLIHALWNIAAKKAGGDVRFAGLTALIMAIIWAPVGLYVGWDIVPTWGAVEWFFICVSGALHVLYFIVLLRGYRKADLTVVYPLARGSGPLLSSSIAILFLNEHLSVLGGFGIVAVVAGVFLIAGGTRLIQSLCHSAAQSDQQLRVKKGVFYGLFTGVFIAAYTVLDGYAVKVLLLSPILVDYFGNFARIVFLAPALLKDSKQTILSWKREWRYALIVGSVSPISYVLVLYAMQTAPLSHVAPAREVSMLFAAIIGGHLLDEGNRIQRILGALCIAAGVIALGNF